MAVVGDEVVMIMMKMMVPQIATLVEQEGEVRVLQGTM